MSALHRASFGYLLRHPWQLALALLGITIGVAVMVAVDLANESSRKAFVLSMDTLNGDATHQVIGGPGGLDESVYVDLRVVHGIRSVAPIVSGPVLVGNRTLQLMGVDLFAERGFRSYTSVQAFRSDDTGRSGDDAAGPQSSAQRISGFLTSPGAVILSSAVAADLDLVPGDAFELVADGRNYRAELLATLDGETGSRMQNLLIADIAVAQHWLGMRGRLTRIDVRIPPGDEELYEKIHAALPPAASLLSASGRTETTAAMSDAFMTNLSAMSLLAMLVGIFLIYNSMAFAVLQRRELIGILRAVGVTRRQVFGLVLFEACALGVAGVLLGLTVGTMLGKELLSLVARTLSDHYFAVTVTNVALDVPTLAKGAVAGLAATLAAAAFPAFEAAAFQPRLAMSRSVLEKRAGQAVPLLSYVGAAMIVAAIVLLALSGTSLFAGLLALFMLILGFGFCIPRLVRFFAAFLAPAAGRVAGVTGRMAIGGIGMTLSRTAVAIVALAIAVSATIGVSVMVDSFRGSVSDWLEATLQSDVYVGVRRGSLDPNLVDDIAALPGIVAHGSSRRSWLETASGRTRLVAIERAPGTDGGTPLRDADAEAVWAAFETEDVLLVSDAYAYRQGTEPGDLLELRTAAGVVEFKVVAIYENYDANDGALMMSRATYDRYFDDPGIDSIGLYLEPGADSEDIMRRIRSLSEGRQALIMSSNRQLRELSLGIFDRTFVITNVLYWLAVGVAIVGILGAMLALQLERVREFGVLRAVGMTPAQTGSLVGLQSAAIGLFAGLAAMPLGLVMAWVLIHVINRRAFGWQIDFTVSSGVLGAAVALAVVAALVGGSYPAWHAARVRPALAMREE